MTQTLFLTGASSGFGEATVRYFAARGWHVAATVRQPQHLHRFADLPLVTTYLLDVTDHAAIPDVVQAVLRDLGHVDLVVNNAGYALYGPIETSPMAEVKAQFETNYFGLLAICQAFIPHLRRQGRGRIVNISSLSAEIGYPFFGVYASSKAAVRIVSEAMATELAPFGVDVCTVEPGSHATQIFTKLKPGLEGPFQAYLPYWRNFLAAQQGVPLVSAPDNVAQLLWRIAQLAPGESRLQYTAGRDARFLLGLRRWLSARAWQRLQVASIEQPPSKAQLGFFRWIMRGTAPLEARVDPRFQAS